MLIYSEEQTIRIAAEMHTKQDGGTVVHITKILSLFSLNTLFNVTINN